MDLSKKDIVCKYNEHAKLYDFLEGKAEIILKKYRKEVISHVHGKVLELAIGTGINLKYYSPDCEIMGVDLSKEMIKIAKNKSDILGINAKFKIADSEKLPFRRNTFDTVVETFSLCTYPNPVKALREMKRVCKKNGEIILLDHGASDNRLVRLFQNWAKKRHYERVGCNLLRNHFDLVRKAGLKVVEKKRGFFGIIYLIRARA